LCCTIASRASSPSKKRSPTHEHELLPRERQNSSPAD
jgi:hypothetical protein